MIVAGVDEAGRGPLAGPVVAAAVVLSKPIPGLTDSKKLTAKKREALFLQIQAEAAAFSIAEASVEEIDSINILQATMLAMKRAVESLAIEIDKVLIDGNRVPDLAVPAQAIVKGDLLEPAISAASVLAKVTRDRALLTLHERYPEYGFASHKGYPTKQHLEAIARYGVLAEHRKSFGPVARNLAQALTPA